MLANFNAMKTVKKSQPKTIGSTVSTDPKTKAPVTTTVIDNTPSKIALPSPSLVSPPTSKSKKLDTDTRSDVSSGAVAPTSCLDPSQWLVTIDDDLIEAAKALDEFSALTLATDYDESKVTVIDLMSAQR